MKKIFQISIILALAFTLAFSCFQAAGNGSGAQLEMHHPISA